MKRSNFITITFIIFLFIITASLSNGQSSFQWKYLDLITIQEPLENLYVDLEVRHLNINGNCVINDEFPTSYQILETTQDRYEIFFFSGNYGMGTPSEFYIRKVDTDETLCFSDINLGLTSICDVELDPNMGQIILADCATNRLVTLSPNGNILDSIDVPFDFVHMKFANQKFFFHTLELGDESADVIKICSPQLSLLKEYRFPSSHRVIPGFNKLGSLQTDDDIVYFNPTYDVHIYEINEVEKKVVFSLDDFVINDDFKKDPFATFFVHDDILYFTQSLFKNYYSFIVDLPEKEVFVVHNSIPILPNKLDFKYSFVFSPVSFTNVNGFTTYVSSRNAIKHIP